MWIFIYIPLCVYVEYLAHFNRNEKLLLSYMIPLTPLTGKSGGKVHLFFFRMAYISLPPDIPFFVVENNPLCVVSMLQQTLQHSVNNAIVIFFHVLAFTFEKFRGVLDMGRNDIIFKLFKKIGFNYF